MSVVNISQGDYIQHHLQHIQLNLHTFKWGNGGFWTLNFDTFFLSVFVGVIFISIFLIAAHKAAVNKPSKFQVAIEMIIGAIDQLVKEIFHGRSLLIGPLALTIFMWVFLLNAMDLVPVDLFPTISSFFGIEDFRSVPTDDINLTFALSFSIFFLILFFNYKIKGPKNLAKEVLCFPFGVWLFPLNIVFKILEEIIKPLSLSLRLFGNMFAGELIFLVIAFLPWWIEWTVGGMWSIFHILIILLQAFIFMMLSVIYISMAHESAH
jgi:F-type H+-transporting ATPase subunit a